MDLLPGFYYVLAEDGRSVIEASFMDQWCEMFENREARTVGRTELDHDVLISSVFVGTDLGFLHTGTPITFETVIFGLDPDDGYQERYSTWEEAERGHQRAVDHAIAVLVAANIDKTFDSLVGKGETNER
jgi:hypothetical protein